MPSLSDVRAAVGGFLRAVQPGRTLVYGRIGDAPAPDGPYLMYRIDTVEHPAYPGYRLTPGIDPAPDKEEVVSDCRISFVISMVGGEAMADAAAVQLQARLSHRWGDVYKVIGHGAFTSIRDLSNLETGTWRARAEFTWVTTAAITVEAVPDVIDTQRATLTESNDGATRDLEIEVERGVKPYGC